MDLEFKYPSIPWRKPTHVTIGHWSLYGCRICIAMKGLKAFEVEKSIDDEVLFMTREECERHIEEEHFDD